MKESTRINDSVFIRHKITKTTRPSNIEKVLIKSKGITDIIIVIIIIIDNLCIALFSGVPILTALYNILQHFLSFTNTIHIIMTTNNV